MKAFLGAFLLALVLATKPLSAAVHPESTVTFEAELKNTKGKNIDKVSDGGREEDNEGLGVFFGPGGDSFGIPGWGNGGIQGGYSVGYGGPRGGYSKGGVIRPTVVSKETGPCYKKTVTCPAKCFTSYSSSSKKYGAGGGVGVCTIDCKKKCIAYR